jgi:hypothetical protein
MELAILRGTYLDTGDVNVCRGSDHVRLVNASQGNTVDLVGAGNQQQSTLQLLQEDNTLSTETTSEEDKDGAGGDGGTEGGGFGGLAALLGYTDILSGVETGSLGGRNETLSAILFATDGLFDDLCRGFNSRLFGLLLALEETALGEDLRAGEATKAGGDFFASGHSGACCQRRVQPSSAPAAVLTFVGGSSRPLPEI